MQVEHQRFGEAAHRALRLGQFDHGAFQRPQRAVETAFGAATAGLPTTTTRLSLDDLKAAEEVFLTSSVFGIWPVARLVDPAYAWPVGPRTRRLMETLAARGLRGGAA